MTTGYLWRKSSRSGGNGQCVELSEALNAIRDSKNPNMMLDAQLGEFIATVKAGKLDR